VTSGRLPTGRNEVVVNAALAARGPAVGEQLTLEDDRTLAIVGTVESTSTRGYPLAVGPLGAFGSDDASYGRTFLIGGGPITWPEVQALNEIGATVTSRAVITDPPPDSELPAEVRAIPSGLADGTLAVVVLIVAMALLEVVLLAGPAFAVGARRQARSIALMVASGGTPAQARRLVLANGVVLGTLASLLGVALGLGVGAAALPVLQSFSDSAFGPYDVPWWTLLGVAGFGLLSAVLAAVVPAWIASRQDVVAVLAGRRGAPAPSSRSPVLGVVLLGLGVVAAASGSRSRGSETLIGVVAVSAVLGMLLLVPLVLAGLARVSGRLPLAGRYAVRDAARHRTRTVPAVAAVAATVAGVVTLGIGGSSDQAEARATYLASLPAGVGVVTSYEPGTDWANLRGIVEQVTPGVEVSEVTAVVEDFETDAATYEMVIVREPASELPALSSSMSTVGSLLVTDGDVPEALGLVPADRRDEATAVLARGGMVAFADEAVAGASADLVGEEWDDQTGEIVGRRDLSLPALWLVSTQGSTPMAILSSAAAEEFELDVGTTGLVLSGPTLTAEQETDLAESLQAVSSSAGLYVERGYQEDDEWVIVLLILSGLASVLMLGGTLTATFLGLSDARPDLATLAAVGASPRSRRGVAASFALVVGLVGAVLGALVGFIPGIAIAYPLTTLPGSLGQTGPYVDIPWLLIVSLVVALPLLTALIVGLTVRSRLPMVARVD
ncbi:MAG: FtsX-like permease family protein, partial [Nocardioides sp.]